MSRILFCQNCHTLKTLVEHCLVIVTEFNWNIELKNCETEEKELRRDCQLFELK